MTLEQQFQDLERRVAHRAATCGHGPPTEELPPVQAGDGSVSPVVMNVCPRCRQYVSPAPTDPTPETGDEDG